MRPGTLLDAATEVRMVREGSGALSLPSETENTEYFEGAANRLVMDRFYNIQFLCSYQMAWYPFDLQTCQLVLAMKGHLALWYLMSGLWSLTSVWRLVFDICLVSGI